jgi:hypothetical protein
MKLTLIDKIGQLFNKAKLELDNTWFAAIKQSMNFSSLLSVNSDPKTIKGLKDGFLTGVQYLAPAKISGWNVCKFATTCAEVCLYTAGRGAFDKAIPKARINRTKFFFEHRNLYFVQLIKEIIQLQIKASKHGLIAAVRLNGMSDLTWERIKFLGKTIFEIFPIQFYDYTKYPYQDRPNESLPSNYHLTYSYSENTTKEQLLLNIDNGRNVAAVFNLCENDNKKSCRNKCKCAMINTYLNIPVIDGDLSDLRFLDKSGVIVGLRAKGEARQENDFTIKIHRTLTDLDIKRLIAA